MYPEVAEALTSLNAGFNGLAKLSKSQAGAAIYLGGKF
jgi:hypothetical protein